MNKHTSKQNQNNRGNLRIKENRIIEWQIKRKGETAILFGKGKIHNISNSGMLLETSSDAEPNGDRIFNFDTFTKEDNGYIPKSGRLVWRRKKRFAKNKYLSGIEFIDPDEGILTGLHQRIDKGFRRIRRINALKTSVSIVFIMAVLALTGYIVWMATLVYNYMRTSNQNMLAASKQQSSLTQKYTFLYEQARSELVAITTELYSTKRLHAEGETLLQSANNDIANSKAIIAQTEAMLNLSNQSNTQIIANNAQLKAEIESLKLLHQNRVSETKNELNSTINLLEEKNIKLTMDMNQLRDQLNYYNENFKDIDKGKILMALYHDKMKLVKSRIKQFKGQAKIVQQAARKERDKIRSILGNNGYFVKNGEKVTVDMEKYQSTDAKAVPSIENTDKRGTDAIKTADTVVPTEFPQAKPSDRKVNIKVDFFK